MTERLATVASALGALIVFAALLFGGARAPEVAVSRPRSQDAGEAGLLGAWRWLERAGVPLARLRERYDRLEAIAAPRGNLLVVAMPMALAPRPAERAGLLAWIARGNTVLLLGSAAQGIAWGVPLEDGGLLEALGLRRGFVADDGPRDAQGCAHAEVTRGTAGGPIRWLRPLPANRDHPVLAGVSGVAIRAPARRGPQRGVWHADPARFHYPLLCDAQHRVPAFSSLRIGDGRVLASDFSELFGNDDLGRADNARLLANIVGQALGRGGRVIFDDMHQGDSVLYDPQAFLRDPRLRATAGFVLAIWLVWLASAGNRFAPPAQAPPRISGLDFVRTLGRFYARHLRPGEAQAALLRRFFDRVHAQAGQPQGGAPGWDLLERDARVDPRALAELRMLQARGARADLVRLRNLTLAIEKALT